MTCRDCEKAASQRESDLLKLLHTPGSWKCTCKRIKAGNRAHAALNENMNHKDKCLLKPAAFGEQRWDGKNMGVTKADLRFLVTGKSKW